jgi:hypothetical protein
MGFWALIHTKTGLGAIALYLPFFFFASAFCHQRAVKFFQAESA